VDFAQFIKIYGQTPSGPGRYRPPVNGQARALHDAPDRLGYRRECQTPETAAEYIKRAEEAKRQARKARNPEERTAYEEIANLWVRMSG